MGSAEVGVTESSSRPFSGATILGFKLGIKEKEIAENALERASAQVLC